ncbi:response regulator transcription factor [Streptomyces sp. Je 1-4]|uniref:response regulator transcription factor n=1 Tax=Streptomyces TaxID=1883 RepID=UPI00140EB5BA|nr:MULTISPECIES: response regulator transcription factor [unclassified Streptomyces]QIK06482.1 response regulator transcription factor [Streptomyces sp. ID38640]UYB39837.1 response regulator transcription factor [Streptomyces sp. Je 1-4]UZQ35897.1 response regulator transcription factor [Streptomyces sp. Je 1-4] [Streptomyces sp. Je 1-4 4N24]UZQ43315.1 response regulator transcription factor [Streptomyces sp. Je 1-4] [Streptomyces sp. Je 1-4 4N24_ara]
MTHSVLLAEDDRPIRTALERALTLEGYQVTAVADGIQALAAAHRERPDVILLDVMMPGIDGLQVCQVLRAEQDRTPILMLTARVETADRIAGLDAGADDYVVKPFEVEEVFARLRALLRRTTAGSAGAEDGGGPGTGSDGADEPGETGGAAEAGGAYEALVADSGVVEAADLRIDGPSRRAWRGERELELTRTEFELLELLARNAGIVLDHSTIYDRIWGYDFGPGSKNLAVYVGYLRRKVDVPGSRPLIHTVRGVGYVLRED